MNSIQHTTSTAARAAGMSEAAVRHCEKLGVVKPARNTVGHRIYTESDVAALQRYAARNSGNGTYERDTAEAEGRLWAGGQARIVVEGAFNPRTRVVVHIRETFPDGRISGTWSKLLDIDQPGIVERNVVASIVRFDVEPGEDRGAISCRIEPVEQSAEAAA